MICFDGALAETSLFNHGPTVRFAGYFIEGRHRMRWKLLLTASLLATIAGAGSALALIYWLIRPAATPSRLTLYALGTLLLPVAAITLASIFVYRHTARRRTLQAMLTALVASILTLTILLLGSVLYTKPAPAPTLAPAPRNVG
jgi:hypothetical protein